MRAQAAENRNGCLRQCESAIVCDGFGCHCKDFTNPGPKSFGFGRLFDEAGTWCSLFTHCNLSHVPQGNPLMEGLLPCQPADARGLSRRAELCCRMNRLCRWTVRRSSCCCAGAELCAESPESGSLLREKVQEICCGRLIMREKFNNLEEEIRISCRGVKARCSILCLIFTGIAHF